MDDTSSAVLSRFTPDAVEGAGSAGERGNAERAVCRSCGGDLTGERLDLGEHVETSEFSRHPMSITECPVCGLLQLEATFSRTAIAIRVSRIRRDGSPAYLDAAANELLERLGEPEGLSAVGFGPFDGPLLERLARRGARTSIVDMPAGSLKSSLRHSLMEGPPEGIDVAAAESAAATGGVSVVVLRHILEHCNHPLKTLETLARATAPDGGLLVVEALDRSKSLARGDLTFAWEEPVLHLTEATLRGLLERAGLETLSFLRREGVLEDALVAVCRRSRAGDEARAAVVARPATSLFADFAATWDARVVLWRARLDEMAGNGKIAVFGGGRRAPMFVNVLGLDDRVMMLVDDDPAGTDRGSADAPLTTVSPEEMIADPDVKLCLLAADPDVHDDIRRKHGAFLERGGIMASIFPIGAGDCPIETPPTGIERVNAEVYRVPGPVGVVNRAHTAFLNVATRSAPRGRVRINMHGDGSDSLHQMIITMSPKSYIRPHKHPGKIESFHIIDGALDVVVFDNEGEIVRIVPMSSDPARGDAICYRMSEPLYHTLIIRSATLTIHEITNGPFVPGGSIFAPFSPEEGDAEAVSAYLADLRDRLARSPASPGSTHEGRRP